MSFLAALRDAHRWNYRLMRRIPERAALLAEVPTLASWDDHDFVGNDSNGTCAGRDEAARAFSEYWANPAAGDGVTPGVFFRHRFGPVEVFALDCRMNRPDVGDEDKRCDDNPSPPLLPLADGPLGAGQTAWALDALASSTAPFKLISCGSRFNPDGTEDSWANTLFDDARNAFFDALADRDVDGVVLLTGDIHRSEIRTVPRASGYALAELTSSPLANRVSDCRAGDETLRACVDGEPSFITVDVDPAMTDPTLTIRNHGADGGVRHRETILRSSLEGG